MPLPPYAKTTIRLAFGSKRQTGKSAHLLFGVSIKIQRCKALPVLAQSKIWHFFTLNQPRIQSTNRLFFLTQNANDRLASRFFCIS